MAFLNEIFNKTRINYNSSKCKRNFKSKFYFLKNITFFKWAQGPKVLWGRAKGRKLYYTVLSWGALASLTYRPVTLYCKFTLTSSGAQQSPKYLIPSMKKDLRKTRMK